MAVLIVSARIITKISLLIFAAVFMATCEDSVGPKDMCVTYGDERCGESGNQEVALWCDGKRWKAKEYCGGNGVCTVGDDKFGTGAHCIYYY